jgi:hypothetical protein
LNYKNYHLFFDSNHNQKILIYPLKSKSYVNYSEAVNICKSNNATLIEIESLEKQNIIESFLHQIYNQSIYPHYWLNAFRDSSGTFKWINSGQGFNYQNWYPNTPYSMSSYPNDNYLVIYGYNNIDFGKWYNVLNSYNCNVICETFITI